MGATVDTVKLLTLTIVASAFVGVSLASAADLAPRTYKAPVAEPVSTWTGFYVGLNAGGAFGPTGADTFGLFGATPNVTGVTDTFGLGHDLTGGFGGAQAGVNWQMTNWVWGFEADVQGGSITGSRTITGTAVDCLRVPACGNPANFVTASEKIDLFGTVRARAGFLATPNLLLYGTGGLAWANLRTSGDYHFATPIDYAVSSSGFKAGWTAGAGFEYKFSGNWSVKGEYLYYDLGSSSIVTNFGVPVANPPFQTQFNFNTHGSLARVGVNYEWNGPMLVRN
jgi:outer membrane immunogenic protein